MKYNFLALMLGMIFLCSIYSVSAIPTFSTSTQSPPTNSRYIPNELHTFTINITGTNSTANAKGIEFNGVNNSLTNVSDIYTYSVSDLKTGTYSYYYWAKNSSASYNTSGIYTYVITEQFGSQQGTYNTIVSMGAGIGILIQYLLLVLPAFILVLAIIGAIVGIFWAVAYVIKNSLHKH